MNEGFKTRLGQMNAEKSAATAERQQLVAKISALESETKTLQDSKTSSDAETAQTSSAELSAQAETIVGLVLLCCIISLKFDPGCLACRTRCLGG